MLALVFLATAAPSCPTSPTAPTPIVTGPPPNGMACQTLFSTALTQKNLSVDALADPALPTDAQLNLYRKADNATLLAMRACKAGNWPDARTKAQDAITKWRAVRDAMIGTAAYGNLDAAQNYCMQALAAIGGHPIGG
jgi:hypothetical protein